MQHGETVALQNVTLACFPQARNMRLAIAGVMVVATAIDCHSVSTGRDTLSSWMWSLVYGAVLWFWWAVVVELMWRGAKRWPCSLRVSLVSSTLHLLVALGIAAIHLGVLQLTASWIARVGPQPDRESYASVQFFDAGRFGIEILMYGLIWFACAALKTQLVAQQAGIRSLELERQLSSAHLQALQMQLEPHFLFNTLNAVTTLVELGRRRQALETLEHLNTVLKLVLKRKIPTKIPLAKELELLESYLAIEQVRFADRLRVDINLDPNALDALVPCFLLQPIVENAIRHGMAHCEDSGWIETSAQRVGTRMRLQVRDNGHGMTGTSANGFGLGLSNTKERLAHFYQNDYEFRAFQPESGGFQVSITIPYEKATS